MSLNQIIATSLIEEIQESAKTKSSELNNPEFEPECYKMSIEVSLSHMDVNDKQNLIKRLSHDDFVDSDIKSSDSSTSNILSFIEDAAYNRTNQEKESESDAWLPYLSACFFVLDSAQFDATKKAIQLKDWFL
ncbi:hypothetical protein KW882_00840 [Vibrio parahaemolyticus]